MVLEGVIINYVFGVQSSLAGVVLADGDADAGTPLLLIRPPTAAHAQKVTIWHLKKYIWYLLNIY